MHKLIAEKISERANYLAEKVMEAYYEQHPQVKKSYGSYEHGKSIEDLKYHFTYLTQSIKHESPVLFEEYIKWVKELFIGLGIAGHLVPTLNIIKSVFLKEFSLEESQLIANYIDSALVQIQNTSCITDTYIYQGNPLLALAENYLEALLAGNKREATSLIMDAVDTGESIKEIYEHVFQATQYEIGRLWQINKISVAQEHYCTAVTQSIMAQLYPYIFSIDVESKQFNFVATSISGELHELGIRMVCDFMEMDGWNTYYLGANMPLSGIIQTVKERKAHVLAIATTMTFHLEETQKLVNAVRNDPEIKDIKIILGGRPFNVQPDLWKKFDADGYCRTAGEAVDLTNGLMKGSTP